MKYRIRHLLTRSNNPFPLRHALSQTNDSPILVHPGSPSRTLHHRYFIPSLYLLSRLERLALIQAFTSSILFHLNPFQPWKYP